MLMLVYLVLFLLLFLFLFVCLFTCCCFVILWFRVCVFYVYVCVCVCLCARVRLCVYAYVCVCYMFVYVCLSVYVYVPPPPHLPSLCRWSDAQFSISRLPHCVDVFKRGCKVVMRSVCCAVYWPRHSGTARAESVPPGHVKGALSNLRTPYCITVYFSFVLN